MMLIYDSGNEYKINIFDFPLKLLSVQGGFAHVDPNQISSRGV